MSTKKSALYPAGSVSRDPAGEFPRSIMAAGAVVWRPGEKEKEYAVIHRPHYGDWSLPKGKVDPGESMPVTAAREIREETGLEVRLGQLLGKATYPVRDRTKVVYYWSAQRVGGSFSPNEEVDRLEWLTADEAIRALSYPIDRELIERASGLPAADARVLVVRHARAHQRLNWAGDDKKRPLDKKGRRQAEMLVPMLLPFRPERIYSALPDRCQLTAAPLADELGLPITVDELLGDDGWMDSVSLAWQRFAEIVAHGGVSVVVGQGIIIPELIARLAREQGLRLSEVKAKKGSCWVLSFSRGRLIAADYLASALPVK